MARLTAKDFSPEILELYDGYVHGKISKRAFLDRVSSITVAGVTAAAVLDQLQPNYALANQVAEDDPDITTQSIVYPSPEGHGEISAYWTAPAAVSEPLPAVLVVHENRGLNPYIKDVARRVAKAGFIAMAPDGLSPLGGYPGTDDEGRTMQRELDRKKLMQDFFAGFEFLHENEAVNGKVGAVGFCYGGGVCNALAVAYPELSASVPFYGRQPDAADVSRIEAPLLIHYAELDARINEGWPAFEEALNEQDKSYIVHFYPGVNHGFHNDTTPRYDEQAAKLAWERTIAFFKEYLS